MAKQILENLFDKCAYLECECGSVYRMYYDSTFRIFSCHDCYREKFYENVNKNEIIYNFYKVRDFILSHKYPNRVIAAVLMWFGNDDIVVYNKTMNHAIYCDLKNNKYSNKDKNNYMLFNYNVANLHLF